MSHKPRICTLHITGIALGDQVVSLLCYCCRWKSVRRALTENQEFRREETVARLFMPEGLDRVHIGSPPGGVETENDAHRHRNSESQGNGTGNDHRSHGPDNLRK